MDQTKKLVTIPEASAILGTDNEHETEKFSKAHGCLEKFGPIKRVDIAKLIAIVEDGFAKMQAAKSERKRKVGIGQELGLICARLELYDGRRKAKLAKIVETKDLLKAAKTQHVRDKFQRDLLKLEGELKKLDDGKLADEKRRNEILKPVDDDSDVDPSAENPAEIESDDSKSDESSAGQSDTTV